MKLINGRNYFNEKNFNEMCEELEKGEHIEVYIDCLGHTRDFNEQHNYRKAIVDKYGDNVKVNDSTPFNYKLKKIECQNCNGSGLIETEIGAQECSYCEFGYIEEE